MAEYIEREAVIQELRDVYEREFPTADGAFDLFANCIVPRVIKSIPAAEVEPVRHGAWEWDIGDVYACSLCGEKSHVKEVMEQPVWEYCPNCGARMDLGGAENGNAT